MLLYHVTLMKIVDWLLYLFFDRTHLAMLRGYSQLVLRGSMVVSHKTALLHAECGVLSLTSHEFKRV